MGKHVAQPRTAPAKGHGCRAPAARQHRVQFALAANGELKRDLDAHVRLQGDYDISGLLPRLDVPVGLHDSIEGVASVNDRLVLACLDEFLEEAHVLLAIDILVSAYAEAMQEGPKSGFRHRVEHFYVPSDWAIAKAERLGLALPMQPAFAWTWDREAESECARIWGRRRADRAEPYARLFDRGIVVAGGSDSPVTDIDPLLGIHAAANAPHPARRISVDDALRMFTVNGAWAAFEERDKGTVEVGKLADLTIIDGDPLAEPEHIKDFTVEMTIKSGEVVYANPGRT